MGLGGEGGGSVMTREIIMAATGIELRELVAEHLMGWNQIAYCAWNPPGTHELCVLTEEWTPNTKHRKFLPDENVIDAFEVVDVLDRPVALTNDVPDGWECTVLGYSDEQNIVVEGETLPLVICRAALLAALEREAA